MGKRSEQIKNEILEKVTAYYLAKKEEEIPYKEGDAINYGGRIYDERELCCLVDAALEFWLTTGRYTKSFEESFSKLLNVKYCLLTNSGSSANLLAFMALTCNELGERRIKKGDEVITVAAGFPTTIAPILQYGAVPVFVDITIPEYNMDCNQLEAALSPKTKAVMLAHTLGNPFDLQRVKAFCEAHDLWLIEDNCDALGSQYFYKDSWHYTGTIGDIGTSSFYPPHHMTMGEGGAVYTNNPLLKRLLQSLRDWGRDCFCDSGKDNSCKQRFEGQYGQLPQGYDHKYVYSHLGYNLKVTDLQAAIGCAQLEKLEHFIKARRDNWNYLKESLKDTKDYLLLPEVQAQSKPSWFGFLILVKENTYFNRNELVKALEAQHVQTRMLFSGNLIKHPCFNEYREKKEGYRVIGNLKETDRVMKQGFWIGVYPGMTKEKLEVMSDIIHRFIREKVRG